LSADKLGTLGEQDFAPFRAQENRARLPGFSEQTKNIGDDLSMKSLH
jgi:hypothetical protein